MADDSPAEDSPTKDWPAEDLPAEDLPAEDLPAEDLPAEDPSAEDPSAEDPSRGDRPGDVTLKDVTLQHRPRLEADRARDGGLPDGGLPDHLRDGDLRDGDLRDGLLEDASLPEDGLLEGLPRKPPPPAALSPNVFTIAPSTPFLPALIRALHEGRLIDGFAPSPLDYADVTIFLPTRRACRLARDAFLEVLQAEAAVLPRIVPLGDIDEDELVFAGAATGDLAAPALALAPALSALERRFLLAQLVRKWAERMAPEAGEAPLIVRHPAAALSLADDLARLMDDMTTREVPWDRLDGLVPDEFDPYWQLTLRFLSIARDFWPAILAERGVIEPAERRDRLIAAEAARLAIHPQKPVIAAGSTGSMPATAKLLGAVARLPRGAVVLPGLDTALDEESWEAIAGGAASGQPGGAAPLAPAPGHPQSAMRALLASLGLARRDVRVLAPPAPHGREKLLSEALRPALTTDRWRARLDALGAAAREALRGVTLIEAANAEEEALAIATVLREWLTRAEGTAALVTPDRALSRRVAVTLRRWDIDAEVSDGDPLAQTGAGVFSRLVAAAALSRLAPVPTLALVKHPLARFGASPERLAPAAAALERAILRGPRPGPGSRGLMNALAGLRGELEKRWSGEDASSGDTLPHPLDPRAALGRWEIDAAEDLLRRVAGALEPLESAASPAGDTDPSAGDFAGLAARHLEAVRRAGADGAADMVAGRDGAALETAFADIIESAGRNPYPVAAGDYLEVFDAAIADRVVERPPAAASRILILGPLEARLTLVDRIVMGSLVEGVWPPDPRTDPWLNRPMRGRLGLDPPERRIALAAHDFAQLMGAREVFLTWPARRGGAPTVASRFLQRFAAVADEAAFSQAAERGRRYLALARLLDAPQAPPQPVARPAPRPPRAARPAALSVTEIEHWLRDPYTIYARHVLRLPRLEAVDAPPGAAERGSLVHDAIGAFAKTFAHALPDDCFGELVRLGRARFASFKDFPEASALWWPRYLRIARWFADFETRRRSGISAASAEIRGELAIAAGARTFRLRGRADRIERRPGGAYAILDFKTGALPTSKQVRAGIAPQLTLEAAMLRSGAFPGLDPSGSVAELVYVRLSGGNPAGEERVVDLKDQSPDKAADAALKDLTGLIARFEDESTPYRPLVLSMWKNRYGTYDDLARVKEWSQSGGEEGEE